MVLLKECLPGMHLLFGKRWWSWQRLLGIAISAAILCVLFRKIPSGTFAESMARMNLAWFAAGFAVYGLSLLGGSFRWHMSLRATNRAIHPSASVRLFFIGHFFFVALFGAAGGDAAKSAVYARWYRFALPEVIAAAPLDRGLGLAGTIVVALMMSLIALPAGGFEKLQALDLNVSGFKLLGVMCVSAMIVIALLFWKPRGDSSWARTIRALRAGGWHFISSPRNAAPGLLFAVVAQFALSAVFALNLRAVASAPLPWIELAWTLPLITILSSMPFTVAGAGVRDVASITFLQLYGVPAGDCVAASMLTLVCKLSWAGIGAGLLWHEQNIQGKTASAPLPTSVSVVIPTLNEATALPETVASVRRNPEVIEIIVADGGSNDGTRDLALELGCAVIATRAGRGGQLRAGAAIARGDAVLLLHADTWLPPHAAAAALNCLRDAAVAGGGFWKEFRDPPWLLRGSKWRCAVRLLMGRRIAGDQALFIRREALERIGGVPDMPLMEEFELCARLRKAGRIALAEATVQTSARRFRERGVLRTYGRMWWVTVRYRFGTHPTDLRRLYDTSPPR